MPIILRCIFVPEFQKKNYAMVAFGFRSNRIFLLSSLLVIYFINVLFPLPALPLIQ